MTDNLENNYQVIIKKNNKNILDTTINPDSDLNNLIQKVSSMKNQLFILKDTLIKTDQGFVNIQDISPENNTINDKKIISVHNASNDELDCLIFFEKDAFGPYVPSKNTFISPTHKIFHRNDYYSACLFLFKFLKDKVHPIKYSRQILYGLLLEDEVDIEINNLRVESMKNNINFNTYYYELVKNSIQRFENKEKKLDNTILWNYWKQNKENENLKMHIKLDITNADLSKYEKDNLDILQCKFCDLDLWNHWLEYGQYESRIMPLKITKDNFDWKRYKKDYLDLSSIYSKEDLWDHWTKYGKNENRKIYVVLNQQNADYEKFKVDYPHLYIKLHDENYNS